MVTWDGPELNISNSEMQLFLDDRRVWWLTYYRRLRFKRGHREVTGVRALGTRVHRALELAYSDDVNPAMQL